jgi:cobalt/nickel transport system permease protein
LSSKKLFLIGLIVSFLVAGFFSFYASSQPDGLQKATAEQGLDVTAIDSPNADSALADYGVTGIDNERLSGFLGGAIGIAVVGIAGTGIYFWVRTPKSGKIK